MPRTLQSLDDLKRDSNVTEGWPPRQQQMTREDGTVRFTEQQPIKQTMEEFSKETTMHGVRYITDNRLHSARRILWTVLLLLLLLWLSFGIIAGTRKYFTYPLSTVIEVKYVERLDFPAVTFCNYNQFRKSLVFTDEDIIHQLLAAITTGNSSAVDWKLYDEAYANYTFNLTRTVLNYGHQLEDMLLECTWNTGEECGTENFTRLITDFGVCYTFHDKTSERHLFVTQAGSSRGLNLRLSVQQDEYYLGDHTGAGFKVMVHPQGEMPMVGQLGVSISPGFETSLAVRHITSESLPHPYKSNCSDRELRFSETYTIMQCTFDCEIKYVLEKCGCRFYKHPGTEETCDPKEVLLCVLPSIEEFYTLPDMCDCPVPCMQEYYDGSLSVAYWPSHFFGEILTMNNNKTNAYIRGNYLQLQVYFDILTDEKISQVPSYNILDLQSDVGAYMGLLCGASIVTIFEFLDFFLVAITRRRR